MERNKHMKTNQHMKKNKYMKRNTCIKRINVFGTLVLTLGICVCMVGNSVSAQEGQSGRSGRISSKGIIDYANHTVVIDSSDLTYLANEIDELERTYKSATVDALNQIGTYYASYDGDISHDSDDNYVSSDTATVLSFKDLYHGILKSQSVDHLADVQAKDSDDNPVYYANEDAAESKSLIMTTASANNFPVLIRAAAAGNLTAGTASWVDGSLIIGNGADNRAYYDKGYQLGYSEGYAAQAPKNARIAYQRHQHSGDAVSGGGCYVYQNTPAVVQACTHRLDRQETDESGMTMAVYDRFGTNAECFVTLSHGGTFYDYNGGVINNARMTQLPGEGYPTVITEAVYGPGTGPETLFTHYEIIIPALSGYVLNCGKTTETIIGATIVWDD